MKKLIYVTLSVFVLSIGSSCKKEDLSNYAKKEDLNDNKIENVDLTIHPNEWAWNSTLKQWEYTYIHTFIGNGALIGFVMGINGKEALPYYDAQSGVTYGLTDNTASNKILITYYDGSTSITAPTSDKYIYLKIIPSQIKKPNVNHSNFDEVVETYSN